MEAKPMSLTIFTGDALAHLRAMPDESVQCCVTSPPYWGLRDYGHEGQMGGERTYQEYVEKMAVLFSEVRRVLKDDGTLWLNLGDTYAAARGGTTPPAETLAGGTHGSGGEQSKRGRGNGYNPSRNAAAFGLKHKDLCGIPWRVAFALQEDGWYLRSDIIWAKPNPMPESVTDRPTKAHEYLFLLTKAERYYYDHEAIKEPSICGDPRKPYCPGQVDSRGSGHDRGAGKVRPSVKRGGFNGKTEEMADEGRNAFRAIEDWRNKRSVWTIPTQPYPEAHFATYPPDLIKPCILAGSRPGDVVLDPFGGSGTTGMVALELGRKAVLIELNPEYVKLIEQRCRVTPGLGL
jgi:DNA modification methylase